MLIRLKEAREFLKGIMAFLDSTGELTDEARAAFMEAMIEEEDSEEEEEAEVNNFLLVTISCFNRTRDS